VSVVASTPAARPGQTTVPRWADGSCQTRVRRQLLEHDPLQGRRAGRPRNQVGGGRRRCHDPVDEHGWDIREALPDGGRHLRHVRGRPEVLADCRRGLEADDVRHRAGCSERLTDRGQHRLRILCTVDERADHDRDARRDDGIPERGERRGVGRHRSDRRCGCQQDVTDRRHLLDERRAVLRERCPSWVVHRCRGEVDDDPEP
jgi:hypothetical protein